MGWSRRRDSEAGFATPAATLIALALALAATAVTGRGVAELHAARSDLIRLKAEQALGGAQEAAMFTVLQARGQDRLQWTTATDAGTATMLAEPEIAKLALNRSDKLTDATLVALGVESPSRLKQRLAELASSSEATPEQVAASDPSRRWRACGASLISSLGASETPNLAAPIAPEAGGVTPRGGEAWRVVARTEDWVEERLVRFTGEPARPAAVLWRGFRRSGTEKGEACENSLTRG